MGILSQLGEDQRNVCGRRSKGSECCSHPGGGGAIEMVDNFTYLGSVMLRDGDVMQNVRCRIAKACRAFECLRGPIFLNHVM